MDGIVSPQNSYTEALTPKVKVLELRFGEVIRFRWGLEGEDLVMGLAPLFRGRATGVHYLPAIYKPEGSSHQKVTMLALWF